MKPADLKAFRKALGLSQEALAAALGLQRNTVARWENGRRAIPALLPASLEALSRAKDAFQEPRRNTPTKKGA